MKKIILFLYCIFFSLGLCAQIPDWILDLANDDTARVSISTPITTKSNTVSESLIIDAVTPSLSIIRQQYRLEHNGAFFGKQNKPYYGETYTLGVKISNNTILQRGVIFPWENDADYKRVNPGSNERRKYQPVYYRSLQRTVCGKDWEEVEFDFDNFTKVRSIDSLLFESQDKVSDFGLPIDETDGKKFGYMIWAYSTTNLQDSSMQVKFSQKRMEIEVKTDGSPINLKESADNALGGIFVVPKIERAGHIELMLIGVAVCNPQNEWMLELMAAKTDTANPAAPTTRSKSRKKKEPKEKPTEDIDDFNPTPIK